MRLLPELGLLLSDPLFDRSYPKSGSELTETRKLKTYTGTPRYNPLALNHYPQHHNEEIDTKASDIHR